MAAHSLLLFCCCCVLVFGSLLFLYKNRDLKPHSSSPFPSIFFFAVTAISLSNLLQISFFHEEIEIWCAPLLFTDNTLYLQQL